MNSNSLSTTVRRNFQCALRKRGYWPTTYMMLLATTALLFLPRAASHMPSRSLMTVTRKRFSSTSDMVPEMEPMAQHSVLRPAQSSCPLLGISTCLASLSSMMFSVSTGSKCVRYTSVSFMTLYTASASVSLVVSRTISPESSSSMSTSSGLAMWLMSTSRTRDSSSAYTCLRPLLAAAPAATARGWPVSGSTVDSRPPPPGVPMPPSAGRAGLYATCGWCG